MSSLIGNQQKEQIDNKGDWCIAVNDDGIDCMSFTDYEKKYEKNGTYSVYGSVKDAKFKDNYQNISKTTNDYNIFRQGIGYVSVYFIPNKTTTDITANNFDANQYKTYRVFETRTTSGGAFGVWRRENTPGVLVFVKNDYDTLVMDINDFNKQKDGYIWLTNKNSTPQKSANTPTTQSTNTQTRQVTERSTTTRNSTIQTDSKSQQITVKVEKADGSPVSGVNVYIFENPNDFVNDKSQLDRYLFGKTKSDGTLSFYVKQLGGLVAIDNNGITEGELVKQYIKQDGTILFKIDSPAPSITGTPNKTVTTTPLPQSQVGVSNSNVVHASKTKTTELQTPIKVQVLYSDKIPVQNVSVFYTPDTNDTTFLSNPSYSKYHINGNAQTGSDGKVTIYTKSRTGLIATKFGNKEFIVHVEPEDWRTTRIILSTPSPERSRKGGDDSSSLQSAECDTDEKNHLGQNATLNDNGECVSASSNGTINISGKVTDEKGQPISDVTVSYYDLKKQPQGTSTKLDGTYTLAGVPSDNTEITFSILSYGTRTLKASDLSKQPNVKLTLVATNLAETAISDCGATQSRKSTYHATAFKLIEDKCVPDECESKRYELVDKGLITARCEDQVGNICAPETDKLAVTGKYVWKNNELICETDTCFEGYTVKDGSCKPTDPMKNRTNENCTKRELQAQDKNATAGTVLVWTEQKVTCTITGCADGWDTDLSNSKCIQSTCICGNQWNKALKKCEPLTDKNCTNTVVGATIAEWDCDENGNSYCKITACDTTNGYELADNKCECATGFERADDGTCTPKMVLTREQYQDEIKELSENAQKMLDNENSLINKTIGAAGIGAVGIGGSMVGAALSERAADDDAERAMRAYLNTFKCEYGDGKQINGGEVNVELPGGNDMFELYTEYATLANDLKVRKEALGLRPGIESEVSIDKSETGLYDDVGTGITGGAYASIARALQNPDGEDAKMWAAMRAATDSKLKTGAIVAGAGAAASLAANIAVNHNVKNDVDKIKREYEALKEPFKNMQKSFDEEPQKTCAELYAGATGSDINNCTCVDNDSYLTQDGCVKCDTEKGLIINQEKSGCECRNSSQILKGTRCEYEDLPSLQNRIRSSGIATPTPQINTCKLKGLVTNECKCISGATTNEVSQCTCDTNNGYVQDGNSCVCNEKDGYKNKIGGGCEKQQPKGESVAQVKIPADSLFDSGKAELKEDAKGKLNTFIAEAQATKVDLSDATAYCLVIVGKTDHQGFKPSSRYYKGGGNQQLSEDRANAVKEYIKGTFNEKAIRSMGIAATDCPTPAKNASRANEKCRRVDIIMLAGSCDDNEKNTNWIETEKIANIQKAISTISNNISSSNK